MKKVQGINKKCESKKKNTQLLNNVKRMSCTVMLRHSDHLDQNYSTAYYPQYPAAAYDYSLDKVASRKRRAPTDVQQDLEERTIIKRVSF